MADEQSSRALYEGEVLITEFDVDDLAELEDLLEEFVVVEEGEELYVSIPGGDRLEVRKLRDQTR